MEDPEVEDPEVEDPEVEGPEVEESARTNFLPLLLLLRFRVSLPPAPAPASRQQCVVQQVERVVEGEGEERAGSGSF